MACRSHCNLSTVHYYCSLLRNAIPSANVIKLGDNICPLDDFPKDDILTIKPGSGYERNHELRPVRVLA